MALTKTQKEAAIAKINQSSAAAQTLKDEYDAAVRQDMIETTTTINLAAADAVELLDLSVKKFPSGAPLHAQWRQVQSALNSLKGKVDTEVENLQATAAAASVSDPVAAGAA